jgi:hypothetical protein
MHAQLRIMITVRVRSLDVLSGAGRRAVALVPSACGEVAHSAEGTARRFAAGRALLQSEPGECGDELLANHGEGGPAATS